MNTKTILVIDDDRGIVRIVEALIASFGFRVISAYDAEIGLLLAKQQQPDLILMDLNMPGLNGFEATFNLKRNPKTAHIPIVILTGATNDADHQTAREVGCDEIIMKPVRSAEIQATLAKHLKMSAV